MLKQINNLRCTFARSIHAQDVIKMIAKERDDSSFDPFWKCLMKKKDHLKAVPKGMTQEMQQPVFCNNAEGTLQDDLKLLAASLHHCIKD